MRDNHLKRLQWISANELAALLGLHPTTLGNWRSEDLRAGRDHAAPGKPLYRRFGAAVRYALGPDGTPVLQPAPSQPSEESSGAN
ncbi:MAG: hypothetical protein RMK57_16855 [Bryobacterales bacterium]|nr:hypothetical protein [Bryobacterales bacterium]